MSKPRVSVASASPSITPRPEWKSWKIGAFFLTLQLIVEIGFIVAIIALRQISVANDGIVSLPSQRQSNGPADGFTTMLIALDRYQGLLWTSLPAFVFTIYKISFDVSKGAIAERAPFVELSRGQHPKTTVSKTLALDYRAIAPWKAWYTAASNRHYAISAAILMTFLLDLAVIPLSARLLVADVAFVPHTISIAAQKAFTDDLGNTRTPDLLSSMDIANGVVNYGAASPPWMTPAYGFTPLSIPSDLVATNISVKQQAQFARLGCTNLDPSAYRVTADTGNSLLAVQITDRGCSTSFHIAYNGNNTSLFAHVWSELGCSADARYSRFGFFGGLYGATDPQPSSVVAISCVPGYWQSNGTVHLLQAGSGDYSVDSYQEETKPVEVRPKIWRTLESGIPLYTQFDAGNTLLANNMGRLVYEYGNRKNTSNPLNGQTAMEGLERLYATLYSALVSTQLFTTVAAPATLDAVSVTNELRLYVVSPIAWTIVVLLILAVICTAMVLRRSLRDHTMLVQEPEGLLGVAVILQGSEVLEYASTAMEVSDDKSLFPYLDTKGLDLDRDQSWFDHETGVVRVSRHPPG